MKTRSKRLAFFAILSALVLSLCFVFMACGESGESGGTTQTEVTITKLSVRINASNKTTYYKGESFDASLTVLRADYSDGSVRHFLPEREEGCTMTPAVFAAGDDSVTFTFGGQSATIEGITVIDADVTSLTVNTKATGTSIPVDTRADFRDLIVNVSFDDNSAKTADADEYKFYLDGAEADVKNFTVSKAGTHKAQVEFAGIRSAEFTITAYEGFVIEAENIYETEDVRPGEKNFVELITATNWPGKDGGSGSGATTNNIAPGPVLSTNSAGVMDEPASDGAYLGELQKGAVIEFHIYSDVARSAHLVLRASSGQIETPSASSSWVPVEMADMKFSDLFTISYGAASASSLTPITTDAVLPGGSTDDPNGDQTLWVNWQDVDFGVIPLVQGDTIVRFEVTSNLVHNNGTNQTAACNIDRLQVEYVAEDQA